MPAPKRPQKAARFEDADSARAAVARLGPRLSGVEPVPVFRPKPAKRSVR